MRNLTILYLFLLAGCMSPQDRAADTARNRANRDAMQYLDSIPIETYARWMNDPDYVRRQDQLYFARRGFIVP